MAKKHVKKKYAAQPLETKKCPYCTGSDGSKKDVYFSPEEARQRAEYIKEIRGIELNVYRCEYGNGWHLTKNGLPHESHNRLSGILTKNGIPLAPLINNGVSWEYIEDTAEEDISAENKSRRILPDYKKSIVRVESKADTSEVSLKGKVTEVLKDANIEKIFNINLENMFSASLVKEFIGEPYQQITVYAENAETDCIDSYTALIKKSLMQKERITKGSRVNIVVSGKCVNNRNVWHCRAIKSLPSCGVAL
jgi:hypothetical protein